MMLDLAVEMHQKRATRRAAAGDSGMSARSAPSSAPPTSMDSSAHASPRPFLAFIPASDTPKSPVTSPARSPTRAKEGNGSRSPERHAPTTWTSVEPGSPTSPLSPSQRIAPSISPSRSPLQLAPESPSPTSSDSGAHSTSRALPPLRPLGGLKALGGPGAAERGAHSQMLRVPTSSNAALDFARKLRQAQDALPNSTLRASDEAFESAFRQLVRLTAPAASSASSAERAAQERHLHAWAKLVAAATNEAAARASTMDAAVPPGRAAAEAAAAGGAGQSEVARRRQQQALERFVAMGHQPSIVATPGHVSLTDAAQQMLLQEDVEEIQRHADDEKRKQLVALQTEISEILLKRLTAE
eukprot:649639-Pleurochrysis_carterae.AAC.1